MDRRRFTGTMGAAAARLAVAGRTGGTQPAQGSSAAGESPFPLSPRALVAADVTDRRVTLAWREPPRKDDVVAYAVYRDFEPVGEARAEDRASTGDSVESDSTYT